MQWGRDAFEKFNGMWGMALYDSHTRKLTLSRDRLGIKPLFVHINDKRVVFGSEIKALLAFEPELARLDLDKAARFIEHSSLPSDPGTFFVDIRSMKAGTTLEFDAEGHQTEYDFWRFEPPENPRDCSAEASAEEFRDLLTDSLKLRFRADVPVGTCLSGGLDSSTIVALSSKQLGLQPAAFSAVYLEEKHNEAEFVRTMVKSFGLQGHEVSPSGEGLDEICREIVYHQEAPVYGPGLFSQWQVMKLASPHVTVLLDGQGGDELFAGYFYYFPIYGRILLERAKRGDWSAAQELWQNREEIQELTGVDHYGNLFRDPVRKNIRLMKGMARNYPIRAVRRLVRPFPPAHEFFKNLRKKSGKIGQSFTPGPHTVSPYLWEHMTSHTREYKEPKLITGNTLTDKLWADVTRLSIPSLLRYEDRNSMAYSLEARVPFLDHRIVEFAFSTPNAHKIEGTWTKQVIRKATENILPEEIRLRKNKMGYPTPFANWLRQPANKTWLNDVLASEQFRTRNFMKDGHIERLIQAHMSEKTDHSWEICRLISLEIFCQTFLDQPFKATPKVRRPKNGS